MITLRIENMNPAAVKALRDWGKRPEAITLLQVVASLEAQKSLEALKAGMEAKDSGMEPRERFSAMNLDEAIRYAHFREVWIELMTGGSLITAIPQLE